MIGILISRNGLPSMGLLIAIIGSAATFLIALSLWWRPLDNSTTSFGIALLGTIAGTIITTWHSHLHMSLILLPALLFLYVKHQLPEWLVDIWIFAFPAIWILTLIIQEFMSVSLIPEINNFGNSVLGITGFLMNCVFLVWAITEHNKQNLASLRI